MSEVVHDHHTHYPNHTDDENNNNDNASNESKKRSSNHRNNQPDLTRYNYMCDDCGQEFFSMEEYIEHYKHYHPRSIGTAIT